MHLILTAVLNDRVYAHHEARARPQAPHAREHASPPMRKRVLYSPPRVRRRRVHCACRVRIARRQIGMCGGCVEAVWRLCGVCVRARMPCHAMSCYVMACRVILFCPILSSCPIILSCHVCRPRRCVECMHAQTAGYSRAARCDTPCSLHHLDLDCAHACLVVHARPSPEPVGASMCVYM